VNLIPLDVNTLIDLSDLILKAVTLISTKFIPNKKKVVLDRNLILINGKNNMTLWA
jgi:hypothetical protein